MGFLKEGEKMKLVAPKLSYIEKTSFEECLKKMKFQDVHIDQNIQQRTIIQDLTFDGCLFENIDFKEIYEQQKQKLHIRKLQEQN